MRLSSYFQAQISQKATSFFVATLRSFEHIAFDRSFDVQAGIFEFFVAPDREKEFIALMQWYEAQGIVHNVRKLPNRLGDESFQGPKQDGDEPLLSRASSSDL